MSAVRLMLVASLLPLGSFHSCEHLSDPVCFPGWPELHHNWTTFSLTNATTSDDVRRRLDEWSQIKLFSSCWPSARDFLCSLYKPECDRDTGSVRRPCGELCVATKRRCAVVEQFRSWPSFTDCSLFPACGNVSTSKLEVGSNVMNVTCPYPLHATDTESHWYTDSGIKGCGIQCMNPLFTNEEHEQVHTFVAVMGSICFFCTFFALLTFFIDWKRQSQFPAVIIIYWNACFCVGSIGWLAQFMGGARDEIVCHSDGTARLGEPSGDVDATPCVIIFILVYYFLMASGVWFAILAVSWDDCFRSLVTPSSFLSGKTHILHGLAWTLPLIKTVIILGLKEVDGDSLSGICFVGYKNLSLRAWFVFGPLGVYLTVGGFFLLRGSIRLCRLKSQALKSSSTKRVELLVMRIGVFAFVAFAFSLTTFACHLHDYDQQPKWEKSLQDYIICQANWTYNNQWANGTSSSGCEQSNRPKIYVTVLQLFSMFGCGVAMSSWAVTSSSAVNAWKNFFRKCKTNSSEELHLDRSTETSYIRTSIPRNRVAPLTSCPIPSIATRSSVSTIADSGIQADDSCAFKSITHTSSV